MANKLKVAFVCVHNSCRSQIAEALCKKLDADMFDCYSAGTVVVDKINPVSGTQIRKNPVKYWNKITKPFKPYLCKNILLF